MYHTKELVENIQPLENDVKVRIILPKDMRTESGIIVSANAQQQFKDIETYDGIVLEKGEAVPEHIKVGSKYKFNKFAGTAIPTKEEEYIKVVDHTMLLMASENNKPEDAKPNHERILVKVTSLKEKTESGIIVPDHKASIYDTETLGGEIIEVSDDIADKFKVGEGIRWEAHSGTEMKMDAKGDFRVIPFYSVVSKIRIQK